MDKKNEPVQEPKQEPVKPDVELKTYRNVGDFSEVQGTLLNRFGQVIPLSDEQADAAIVGGAELVKDADFKAVGFTDEELRKFPDPVRRMKAPTEFMRKYFAVREIVATRRAELEGA